MQIITTVVQQFNQNSENLELNLNGCIGYQIRSGSTGIELSLNNSQGFIIENNQSFSLSLPAGSVFSKNDRIRLSSTAALWSAIVIMTIIEE